MYGTYRNNINKVGIIFENRIWLGSYIPYILKDCIACLSDFRTRKEVSFDKIPLVQLTEFLVAFQRHSIAKRETGKYLDSFNSQLYFMLFLGLYLIRIYNIYVIIMLK